MASLDTLNTLHYVVAWPRFASRWLLTDGCLLPAVDDEWWYQPLLLLVVTGTSYT
jgi:hypothetical protein